MYVLQEICTHNSIVLSQERVKQALHVIQDEWSNDWRILSQEEAPERMYVLSQEVLRRKVMLEEIKILQGKRKVKGKCGSRHSPGRGFFGDDTHAYERKKGNHERNEMFIADSRYTSHMVNRLRNITNLLIVKTELKIVNKKTMMGSLQGYWRRYQ